MEEEIVVQEIDIGSVIIDTINTLCQSLFSSVEEAVFPLLDKLVFIREDIATTHYLERIIGTDTNTGLLVLANALLFAFIIYYSARLIMSPYSGQPVESPYQFFIKSIFIAIFMNCSLSICITIVSATSDITDFVSSLSNNIFKTSATFSSLIEMIDSSKANFNVFSINGILSGVLSMSSLSLIISFALRYIMVKVLILLSPFAILCLLNHTTTGLFKSWYKCFLTLLILQILISLIMLLPYAIIKETTESPMRELLLVGTIMALLKANGYVKEIMGGLGISNNFQTGIGGIKSMFMR